MDSNQPNFHKLIIAFAVFAIVASGLMYLYFMLQVRGGDWTYFDSLALVIRSSVLNYHTFPLHDPWACSGNSLLANPQNWIFSPLVLLTLIFPPTFGNILSVLIMKGVGFWGALKYFEHLKVERWIALLCAALFVNTSWFALHFIEGHIIFRSFYLLPLAFYYMETLSDRKTLMKLGGVVAFMILDGGFYALVFSLVYFILFFLLHPRHALNVFGFLRKNLLFLGIILAGFLLLSVPKLYPMLLNASSMRMVQESHQISLSLLWQMLFDPFKNGTHVVFGPYRFQEYGSYLGYAAFALLVLGLVRFRNFDKTILRRAVIALVFLWMATGWGGAFNPYTVLSSLPLINKIHLQVRYILLFSLTVIGIIAMIAHRLPWKKVVLSLLVLANFEVLLVNFNSYSGVGQSYSMPLITKEKWSVTRPLLLPPNLYYEEGVVSKLCYEPSRTAPLTKSVSDEDYRGELFPLSGNVKFEDLKLTPGEISFSYKSPSGGSVLLNTNFLDGWIETGVGAEPFEQGSLLGVRLPPGEGRVSLQYLPEYYTWIILAALLGVFILIFAGKKIDEL